MNFVKSWCENIIIVVIISVIFEMILPEKSKKYAKIVSGVYLLYVIMSPLLSIDKNFDYKKMENLISENEVQVSSMETVGNAYITGLKNTIKKEIEENNYKVEKLDIKVSNDYSDIEKIDIKILGNYDSNKIKEIILKNIEIDENKIIFL